MAQGDLHPRRLAGLGQMGSTSSPEPSHSLGSHLLIPCRVDSFPPSLPPRGLACWLPSPPASTSAGSDLWSLRGGWESQEGNTVMIGDGGGVL